MNLMDFASNYKLHVKRNSCSEPVILGKLGHLYEHAPGRFGLALEAAASDTRLDNTLRARKRKALGEGFQIHQQGDAESILLFDPTDSKQARLAIRLVGAKRKRQPGKPSAAQIQARALFSARAGRGGPNLGEESHLFRPEHVQEGPARGQNGRTPRG